ncbi:hypothetical protein RJ640_005392 [Escallonia rubra]|uniref:DUF4005 domain-containing protein n=1 Tax=Escallonia rubra TaxID=112253 RepID=A0AA88UJG5_9ASTE|nr:hypothetical protein RJ640_005392 [Escallonia rubra]
MRQQEQGKVRLAEKAFLMKVSNEKGVWLAAKTPEADLALDTHLSSDITWSSTQKNEGKLEENGQAATLPLERGISVPAAYAQESTEQAATKDPETIRQEQAATKAQAALRGILARRAFRALKGIIRLQALFRGHLVRRQAVSTLHCMLGIVKLQALARGRKVRQSDIGIEVQKQCILDVLVVKSGGCNSSARIAKLSANAFALKLLAASPTALPLHLQFDSEDPNSVLNWLDGWSASRFWETTPEPKKAPGPKSQRRQGITYVNTETGRQKYGNRRIPAANVNGVSVHSTTELEKPKRNLRKVSSKSTDSMQENPQRELEKVKRNLRKVHAPITGSTIPSESEGEKPKAFQGKVLSSSGQDVVEHSMTNSTEKIMTETVVIETQVSDIQRTPEPLAVNEVFDSVPGGQPASLLLTSGNGGSDDSNPGQHGDFSSADNLTSNENQKSSQKVSFPAKQESPQTKSQSKSRMPSYMAATESAKAKLRVHDSARLGQDGLEKHNLTRRQSLPSSSQSKTTSLSPRAHRLIQTAGKVGYRSDRSLLSSRDGNGKNNLIVFGPCLLEGEPSGVAEMNFEEKQVS